MPQTEEHAQILDLLDVRHGLVALTKADLVDDDTLELRRLEVEERLGWPVVVVDSVTGRGRRRGAGAARRRSARTRRCRAMPRRPRVWVDRVFAAKGAGTVVTGTLTGGALARDDEVAIEPGGRRARVRRIESHHEQLDRAAPGSRVALNLAGVDHTDIAARGRGRRAGSMGGGRHRRRRAARRARTVTGAPGHGARARRVGRATRPVATARRRRALRPAEALDTAPARAGRPARAAIVGRADDGGGAEVLDVAPARRTADALERLRLPLGARVLAARPWCTPAELGRLAGDEHAADGYAIRVGSWLDRAGDAGRGARPHRPSWSGTGSAPLTSVAAACRIEPAQLRAALADDPGLAIEHDIVRRADQAGALDDPAARRLLDALEASPLAPPAPADVGASPSLVRALVRTGAVVDLDGVVFATSALDDARVRVAQLVVERETITVADVRDLLGTSRKYVLPIVNRMDAEGVTRRRGDLRIPGPRARPA